jgi:hypothetical protein
MAKIDKGGTLPDTGVTKAEVYALVDSATISEIVNADISNAAAIADTKLATITTANKVNVSALVVGSQAGGDIITYSASSSAWTRLGVGSAGQTLTVAAGASACSWA